MNIMYLLPLLTTLATAGFINGAHFHPATNLVSSRTIVGTAVGGGPSSGAISSTQYSQTISAPATVQTIITSQPAPAAGYTSVGLTASPAPSHNTGAGSTAGVYGNYVYSTSSGGSSIPGHNSGTGGYSRQGVPSDGLHVGHGYSHSPYYNQRY